MRRLVRVVLPLIVMAAGYGCRTWHAPEKMEFAAALQPERMLGCVLEDGAVRLPPPLPTPTGKDPLVVETESPDSVRWQKGESGVVEMADAGGGAAAGFITEAVYHVNITQAGYYWYWQRAWIPRTASWSHNVQIDDRVPLDLRFGTRKEDQAETWFWIGGETRYYLKPGVHTVAIRNLHNGKRLDRFVLTTDEKWQPEGMGPPTTPIVDLLEGQFLAAPIAPLSLLAWEGLAVRKQGSVTVEVAMGDGDFQPLPADGSLAGAATPLQVRVRLAAVPDQPAPEAALGPVRYLADPAAFHVLANDAAQVVLHRATGRLCGLRDPRSGRAYLPDGLPNTLFTLDLKPVDVVETHPLSADDAKLVRLTGNRRRAHLEYRFPDAGVSVNLDLELTRAGVVETAMEVLNGAADDIVAVTFPRLAEARAGFDGTDDMLCFPSKTGRLYERPGQAGTVDIHHPVGTAIGFCDLYDRTGGVMLAPMDFPMVLTRFMSAADPGGESATLSLTRLDRIRPGRSATYHAAIGLHTGDWHAAADWYREWFAANVGKADIPAWVYAGDGYVTTLEPEAMAGLGFHHIQMWRETGHGACPTYYLPDPAYRAAADYRQAADEWRALGGHMGVYYHGNSISRSYIQADKIYGIPVADIPADRRPPSWQWFVDNRLYGPERTPVEKLDMSEITEPADHEEYPLMSWQGGNWAPYLRHWAIDIWLREYGLDTPYWDTLGCGDRADYNPHYGFNGEGRGAMAKYRFLVENQRLGRQVSPGFYQLVEGGSELLGLVVGQLESNFVDNLEVGRYTHPDQIYYIGHSNGWWNPPMTHLAVCRAFYLNTKYDLIRLNDEVMQVVRCRRWFAPWLYDSTFKDTVGLAIGHDQVPGALHVHRGKRGDALVATFMNWQRIGGVTARVDLARYLEPTANLRAFRVVQGGEPEMLAVDVNEGWVELHVPTAPVSAVLFLADPERALPVAQARQENAAQSIRVFDPAGKARAYRLTLTTAEAAFQPDADGRITLANEPGETMFGRVVAYTDYDALQQIRHVDITLTTADGVEVTTRSLVQPHFADPGFEAPEFATDDAHGGARSLRLDPQQLRHFPLNFIPGHRYRVSLWIKRQETTGAVYANVYEPMTKKSHIFGNRVKPGEWTRVSTEYTMPKTNDQPQLYLYDWQGTTLPAWFDDVHVEDLGPVE